MAETELAAVGQQSFGFADPERDLASDMEGSSAVTSSDASKPSRALGMTNALHLLQLDDYEIKPSEIEVMLNLDGSPAILGRGAFGEVSMMMLT